MLKMLFHTAIYTYSSNIYFQSTVAVMTTKTQPRWKIHFTGPMTVHLLLSAHLNIFWDYLTSLNQMDVLRKSMYDASNHDSN